MERRPRRYVTLEGYAVEGGFDDVYQPSTCFRPTIALGRHVSPGEADGLWHDYERVLDLVPTTGLDGVRLSVEWARIEPRQGFVDHAALERYAGVARYAHSLGLGVTLVVIDAAWPAWLGLEAWLLPWVAPLVLAHARRLVETVETEGVVVFANPRSLVDGYLDASAPPWRRGAREDAQFASTQIDSITSSLRSDAVVGPKVVASSTSVRIDMPLAMLAGALTRDCDELYIRSLVRGHGPTASAGLAVKDASGWRVDASEELLDVLR